MRGSPVLAQNLGVYAHMMHIGTIDSEELCITLGYVAEVLAKFHRMRLIVEGDKESSQIQTD